MVPIGSIVSQKGRSRRGVIFLSEILTTIQAKAQALAREPEFHRASHGNRGLVGVKAMSREPDIPDGDVHVVRARSSCVRKCPLRNNITHVLQVWFVKDSDTTTLASAIANVLDLVVLVHEAKTLGGAIDTQVEYHHGRAGEVNPG